MVGYVAGQLEAGELEGAREHIDRCSACRALVAELARSPCGEAPPPSLSPTAAVPFGERYGILRVIGAGASGVVYAAHDHVLRRKVALKVLRAPTDDSTAQRLLREARMLARFSHPNIVKVHDVGQLGEQTYLCLEDVEGATLATWQKGRCARDVLGAYLQAGRGLAHAHQLGLVHRDFKPENVLVGDDGGVRLADFGLARGLPASPAPSAGPGALELSRESSRSAHGGTPTYMAPEQLRGRAADALTDQFSFCVALFEGLCGARPFTGTTLDQLAQSMERTTPELPLGAGVPRWLRRVIARGLSHDRSTRFASMQQLLATLERGDPARLWRLGAATAAALALAVSALFWASQRREVCQGGPEQLASVWSGADRRAAQDALRASGSPAFAGTWRRVSATLDSYRAGWLALHREACEAHRRAERSELMLDAQMRCLDQRRLELASLARLLGAADRTVADHAAEAAHALTPLGQCSVAKVSAQPAPGPFDAAAAARYRRLTAQLVELKALKDTGRAALALERAAAAVSDAEALQDSRLQARARLLEGQLRQARGDPGAAEQALYQAVALADAAGDDRARAEALNALLNLTANACRAAQTLHLAELSGGAIRRLGGDDELEAGRLNGLAALSYVQGRLDDAFERFRQVQALRQRALGPDSPQAIDGAYGLGVIARARGQYDEALELLETARSGWGQLYGTDHRSYARALNAIGATLIGKKRHAEACLTLEQAVDSGERALGPEHPELAAFLQNLASCRADLRDFGGAVAPALRAVTIARELEVGHHTRATALATLARVYVGARRDAEAVELANEALASRPEAETPPRELAEMKFILATALWGRQRDRARARALATWARDVYSRAGEPFAVEQREIDTWLVAHR